MNTSVVIPTVNSIGKLKLCVESLVNQTTGCEIIVVTNGTTDGTQKYLKDNYPNIILLDFRRPLGFAGAVNKGISYAVENGSDCVALLNNDAVADKDWLRQMTDTIHKDDDTGIVTSKIKQLGSDKLDTTGDCYTSWLLPYPRGRGEVDSGQYDLMHANVTAASGGASLYRTKMLREIGLFDEDFFAYYEDVDISIRAQHRGWKIAYNPKAIVEHEIGGTSKNIKGFNTLQTMKNLPLLYIKNVPARLLFKYIHGFNIVYTMFFLRAILRGQGYYALKGFVLALILTPKKILERRSVLKYSRLSTSEFDSLLVHDLPPNAKKLRAIRSIFGDKK